LDFETKTCSVLYEDGDEQPQTPFSELFNLEDLDSTSTLKSTRQPIGSLVLSPESPSLKRPNSSVLPESPLKKHKQVIEDPLSHNDFGTLPISSGFNDYIHLQTALMRAMLTKFESIENPSCKTSPSRPVIETKPLFKNSQAKFPVLLLLLQSRVAESKDAQLFISHFYTVQIEDWDHIWIKFRALYLHKAVPLWVENCLAVGQILFDTGRCVFDDSVRDPATFVSATTVDPAMISLGSVCKIWYPNLYKKGDTTDEWVSQIWRIDNLRELTASVLGLTVSFAWEKASAMVVGNEKARKTLLVKAMKALPGLAMGHIEEIWKSAVRP